MPNIDNKEERMVFSCNDDCGQFAFSIFRWELDGKWNPKDGYWLRVDSYGVSLPEALRRWWRNLWNHSEIHVEFRDLEALRLWLNENRAKDESLKAEYDRQKVQGTVDAVRNGA